jgi:hypothetical protein
MLTSAQTGAFRFDIREIADRCCRVVGISSGAITTSMPLLMCLPPALS